MATDKQPSEIATDPGGQSCSSIKISECAPPLAPVLQAPPLAIPNPSPVPSVTTVSQPAISSAASTTEVERAMPIAVQLPTTNHTKPPLRFDREFHNDPNNQLKIVQLATGAVALVLTNNCYPNQYVSYCTNNLYSFFQLFNVVCVHAFFFIGTAILALCFLLSVPDAYYKYNFPLLEKFYTTLATAMYSLASAVALINLFHAVFSFIWFFHVGATIVAFLAYFYDFWNRWKSPAQNEVV